MLKDGTYVRMIKPWGSAWITGTVTTEMNYLGKPQMLLRIDPRLGWKPDAFYVYEGSVEECLPPSDAEVERRNKLFALFDSQ